MQRNVKRWHQTLKNIDLFETAFCPVCLVNE